MLLSRIASSVPALPQKKKRFRKKRCQSRRGVRYQILSSMFYAGPEETYQSVGTGTENTATLLFVLVPVPPFPIIPSKRTSR